MKEIRQGSGDEAAMLAGPTGSRSPGDKKPASTRLFLAVVASAIIEQYRRGFATMDVEVLKAIWDQDYDNLIYIAQEAAQPVRGWTRIEQYYRGVKTLLIP